MIGSISKTSIQIELTVFLLRDSSKKATVSEPEPHPGSSRDTSPSILLNKEAMYKLIGLGVKNCPNFDLTLGLSFEFALILSNSAC